MVLIAEIATDMTSGIRLVFSTVDDKANHRVSINLYSDWFKWTNFPGPSLWDTNFNKVSTDT